MKLFSLILVCLLSLNSCDSNIKLPKAPSKLIPRDSMVMVMKDMIVLESYVQERYQNINSYYKVMTLSGKECLKKHHISTNRYETSFNHYMTRKTVMIGIYNEILDSLTKEVTSTTLAP